jgi:hypothetical protein
MHSSRSSVYGETLARCTRAVYPLAFFGRRQDQGRAGKIRGPVQNFKIGPYLTVNCELYNIIIYIL